MTVAEGAAFVFWPDHCRMHRAPCRRGTRFEALSARASANAVGGIGEGVARGLRLRCVSPCADLLWVRSFETIKFLVRDYRSPARPNVVKNPSTSRW